MNLTMKLSEDVIPFSDLRSNPTKIIKQVQTTHRPILLTNRGRGVAVIQALDEYEAAEEERNFIKAISIGLIDIQEGRETSLQTVKKKLGLSE